MDDRAATSRSRPSPPRAISQSWFQRNTGRATGASAFIQVRPGAVDRHLAWIHGFRADLDVPDEASGGTWL